MFWRSGKTHGERKVGTAGTGLKGEKGDGRKTLALAAMGKDPLSSLLSWHILTDLS